MANQQVHFKKGLQQNVSAITGEDSINIARNLATNPLGGTASSTSPFGSIYIGNQMIGTRYLAMMETSGIKGVSGTGALNPTTDSGPGVLYTTGTGYPIKIQDPDTDGYVLKYSTTGGRPYWTTDSNTTYNLNTNYNAFKKVTIGEYPIGASSLCAFDTREKLMPFVTTYSTSTSALIPSTIKFPIGSKIYYANTARTANTTVDYVATICTTVTNFDLRYSSVNHNVAIFPNDTFNRIFMPVDVDFTDMTFTLKTQSTASIVNNFTNQRNLISGNYYIEIGHSSGSTSYTSSYYSNLIHDNTLYYYDGTNLINVESMSSGLKWGYWPSSAATVPAESDFVVKRSYNEYPTSSMADGVVYVRVGTDGVSYSPEYSSRLGGGTTGSEFLQLDKDKVYVVENPTSERYGSGTNIPYPGTIKGKIPGLHGYFNGLKISIPMNFQFPVPDLTNVYVNLSGDGTSYIGDAQVYIENQGRPINTEIILAMPKSGSVLMEYRTDIPSENNATVSGFVICGNLYDPRETTDFVRTGGSSIMTGNLKMGNNKIVGLANPTEGKDAVNLDTLNEKVTQLTNIIYSPTNSVSEPDTLLSAIDGEKQVSYAYYINQQTSSGGQNTITGNTLGFETSMLPNSCIHIFAYSSAHAKYNEIATPYTYSGEDGYVDIPARIFGGGGDGQPTNKDYTFINGEATYVGVNGLKPNDSQNNPQTESQAHYVSTPRRFKIPAYGMIEISVFYNVFTKPGTQDTYSRTVVKCDAEEIPYA